MLTAFLLSPQAVNVGDRRAMVRLFQTHFQGIEPRQFEADLRQKDWLILLKQGQEVKGFTSFCYYPCTWQGETFRVIYSGDTITDPSIWSSPLLAKAWLAAVQTVHRDWTEKLYWLLISSGYRTYRFLSIFAREFYPCYRWSTPRQVQWQMDYLAQQRFGAHYQASEGIVRFPLPQILSPSLQAIAPAKFLDPHVRFFVERNPGHHQGDELVCLAPVAPNNLTKAGQRLWRSPTVLKLDY